MGVYYRRQIGSPPYPITRSGSPTPFLLYLSSPPHFFSSFVLISIYSIINQHVFRNPVDNKRIGLSVTQMSENTIKSIIPLGDVPSQATTECKQTFRGTQDHQSQDRTPTQSRVRAEHTTPVPTTFWAHRIIAQNKILSLSI